MRPHGGGLDGGGQHVFRQCDHHGARQAGGGDLDRTEQRFRQARGIGNLGGPFGDGPEHADVVDLLERVAPQVAGGNLADQQQAGHAVLLRGVHGDGGVAGTGTAAHAGDAGPPGQPRIGQGHEPGAGLVAAHDRINVGASVQGVQQAEVALAGDAEHPVDPMSDQGVDQQRSCGGVCLGRKLCCAHRVAFCTLRPGCARLAPGPEFRIAG